MKFVMIREFNWDLSKDKIILGETDNHKISIAYLIEIRDFDFNDEYNILYNTDSIQIRPKAIYKNNKGYYKKENNKRVYFNEEESKKIVKSIEKFTKYLLLENKVKGE